jgi:hypothetical protein
MTGCFVAFDSGQVGQLSVYCVSLLAHFFGILYKMFDMFASISNLSLTLAFVLGIRASDSSVNDSGSFFFISTVIVLLGSF